VAPSLRGLAAFLLRAGRRTPSRIGYVVPLGGEVREWMRSAERRLQDRYGTNPALEEDPHITVKQAFAVDAVEPYEQYLERLAGQVEPFEVVLRGIGVFEGGIVFLDVAPEPRLEALRQRVLRDLAAEFGIQPYALEGPQYRFHATLGYGLSETQAAQARQALEADAVEFHVPVDALGLLYQTGAGWTMSRRSKVARTRAASRDGSAARRSP
jgi:2'-5' RNA ligase